MDYKMANDPIYKAVATYLAARVREVWDSEDSMKKEWEKSFTHMPFDRTHHWQSIVYRMFRECWVERGPLVKVEPTGFDRLSVLRYLHPLLDYNLFSQVLLNLQTYNGMAYQTQDAQKELQKLKTSWEDEGLNPFAPSATMIKSPNNNREFRYNHALSTIRSLSTIQNFTPQISFRVSPMGSTPALADANNLSMLGIGADQYLRVLPQLEVYYLVWDMAPVMAVHKSNALDPGKPGVQYHTLEAPGIPYAFHSKSGGEVLQEVLFARKLMYTLFEAIDVTKNMLIMLPRMSSLLVVADKHNVAVADALKGLQKRWSLLQIRLGSRMEEVRAAEVAKTVSEVADPDVIIEQCAGVADLLKAPVVAQNIRRLKGKFSIKYHGSATPESVQQASGVQTAGDDSQSGRLPSAKNSVDDFYAPSI